MDYRDMLGQECCTHRDTFYQACWIQIRIMLEDRFGEGSESEHINHLKEQSSKLWLFHSIEERDSLVKFIKYISSLETIPKNDHEMNEIIEQHKPKKI